MSGYRKKTEIATAELIGGLNRRSKSRYRYELLPDLPGPSATGMQPSSLQGRIHGVFWKAWQQ